MVWLHTFGLCVCGGGGGARARARARAHKRQLTLPPGSSQKVFAFFEVRDKCKY